MWAWAMLCRGQTVAHAAYPLSTLMMDPKEQQDQYSLAPATLQELREWRWVQRQAALGTPTSDFSSRFTPEAIAKEGRVTAEQQR